MEWDPCQPMVKLSVGAKPDIVYAHEGILCKSSDYFKNAMKPEWAEQRRDPYTIDLSDDSIDEVKLYVKWLYTGNLDIRATKGKPSEERNMEAENHYAALVKACVFGEKVLDNFFNTVLLEKLLQIQKDYDWTPGPDVFRTLYSGTPAGCRARRLMTQFVAHNAHFGAASEWHAMIADYPHELLIDVVKAMASLRNGALARPWDKTGKAFLDTI